MPELTTLMIANRGEIAIRIARAAQDMGLRTVGICPVDDMASLHTRHVDILCNLPGAGASAYLDIDAIVRIAEEQGCDVLHPGYGFLSENAELVHRCEAAGIVFAGPTAPVLEQLGDKVSARALAQRLDVPLSEGTEAGASEEEVAQFMASLGPNAAIMIKAVSGGGGRGMRVVRSQSEVRAAYAICRSEGKASFGNDAVYAERFIPMARHVEIQIIGDGEGGVCHLWDRECSLQRRHQKVIEIAPCPNLPMDLRQAMIDASLRMARDVTYRSLGTFEFLVDVGGQEDGRFYFMEANPRLQVEHTVTEEVTGVDLVQLQLKIAKGATLADLRLDTPLPHPSAYAIQARLTMEKIAPDGSAIPASGVLTVFDPPSGPGIRVDSFGYAGYRTSTAYDALLAKVIAVTRGQDFAQAVGKLRRALSEMRVEGVDTNLDFLQGLLSMPEISRLQFHTRYIEANAETIANAALGPRRHVSAQVQLDAKPLITGGPTLPDGEIGVLAPMQGLVVSVDVRDGDIVTKGQQLGLIEAMKMQMAVTAPASGHITFAGRAGEQAKTDAALFHLLPDDNAESGEVVQDIIDLDFIGPELADLRERNATLLDAARPAAVAKRHKLGKRTIRENLADFFDETRFDEFGSLTLAAQRARRSVEELISMSPADGLIAGFGSVNSDIFDADHSRCMTLAYDYTVLAGTQGINSHHKKDRMLTLAEKWRSPVMIFAEGGGGRPGDTDYPGISGLSSMTFRRLAALNGKVPLVGVVTGRCFAGNAAMLGCCDVIIATQDSTIGMAGPAMIEGGGLGIVKPDEVGPVSVQEPNGVIDIVVEDEAGAIDTARRYLSYFQGERPDWEAADQRRLRHVIPQDRLRAYDVRMVIDLLADTDTVMELRKGFASGLVTALIRIEGKPMGLIANDPRILGGAIDADAADKTARFMQLCDAFGLPILSLCDTPGFMVGPEAEKTALVRHVSRMFVTSASLDVPMVTLVLRKGYGLGAMGMSAGSFHAVDATLAWPTGEFGGMGLEGAVRLAYRNDLAAAEGEAQEKLFRRLVDEMYEKGKATNIAAALEIDDVIDPAETRTRVVNILRMAGPPVKADHHKRIDTW